MNFFIRLFFIIMFYFWSFVFADIESGDDLYPINFPFECKTSCKIDITYEDLDIDDNVTSDLILEYRGAYSGDMLTLSRNAASMEFATGLRIVNETADLSVQSMHYIYLPLYQPDSASTKIEKSKLIFTAGLEMSFYSGGGETPNPVPRIDNFIEVGSEVSTIVIRNSATISNRTYLREDEKEQGNLFYITGDKSMIGIGEDASISAAGTALYFDKQSIYSSSTSTFGIHSFTQYLTDFEDEDLHISVQFKPSYICEADEEDCGSFYETYGIDEPTELEFNFIALVESFFGQVTSYDDAIHLESGNGYFAVNDFADIQVRGSGNDIYVSGKSSALIYIGSYSNIRTDKNSAGLYFDNEVSEPNEIVLVLNGSTIEAGYDEEEYEKQPRKTHYKISNSYGIYSQADEFFLYVDSSGGSSNSISASRTALFVGDKTQTFNFFINSDIDITIHDPDGYGGEDGIVPDPAIVVTGVDTVNLIAISGDMEINASNDNGISMYFSNNGNVDIRFESGEKSEDDTTLFDVTLTSSGALIFENNTSLNLDLGKAIINGNNDNVAIQMTGNGSSFLNLADGSDIKGDIYLDEGTEAEFGNITIRGNVYMGNDSTLTMDSDTSITQGKFDGTSVTGETVTFSCSKYDSEGTLDDSKTCTIKDENYIDIDNANFESGVFEFKGNDFNKNTFVNIKVRSKAKIYFRNDITVQDITNEGTIYVDKNLTLNNYIVENNSYTYVTLYGDDGAFISADSMRVNGNHKIIIQNDIYEYKDIIKNGSYDIIYVKNLEGEINFDDNMAILDIVETKESSGLYTVTVNRIKYSDLINSLSLDTSSIQYINTIKIANYLDKVIETDRYSQYIVLINNLDAKSPTANSIYNNIDQLNPLYNNENIKALENTQKNVSNLIMSNFFSNRFRTYNDRFWGTAIMNFNGGDSSFGYNSIGGFIAKDYFRTKNTRVGFGGNFVHNNIDSRSHNLITETFQAFGYGTYRPYKVFVDAVVFAGYNFNKGQKTLSFMEGAFEEFDISKIKYHFHSLQVDFNIEAGYIIGNLKTITLEPFVFLDNFYNQGYSYNEKNVTNYQSGYSDQSNLLLHVSNPAYSSNYFGFGGRLNINMNLFSNELVYTGSYSLIVEYKLSRNLKYGRFNNTSSYYVIGEENTNGIIEHTEMGEYYNTVNISYKVSEKYKHFLISYTFDKSGNFINNTFGFKYYIKLKNKVN